MILCWMLKIRPLSRLALVLCLILRKPQSQDMTATGEKGDTVEMTANVKVKGDITQDGNMTSTGDHKAGGISLTEYTHTGVQPGGGNTGQPQ